MRSGFAVPPAPDEPGIYDAGQWGAAPEPPVAAARFPAGPAQRDYAAAARGAPAPVAPPVGGALKRCFDIGLAAMAIVLLLPLLLLIALAVKLADGGPALYRHRRIGRNGVPFDCLKFRTMVADADQVLQRHLAADDRARRQWAEKQKLTRDPRITPLGATLRRTSIDELPQLINILKGEMSVVGPRPIVSSEAAKYGDCMANYLRARPGLTGPWQISGRNDVDYAQRISLDREYVENWSFRRDLAIILGTVRVVVTARGCY